MGEAAPFIFFVLFAAGIVAIILFAIRQAAKRRAAWAELAARLGCTYYAEDPHNIPESHPHALFHRGFGRHAYNAIEGRVENRDVLCFDYLYKERHGSGKNRRTETYHFTCLLMRPPVAFQPLFIRPETFLDRIGEFIGFDDIDFESDEFSRRFHVKCADKKFAYDILHPRAMELLLDCGKIHIEAQGDSILFYYTGRLSLPDKVEALIRAGVQFVGMIPNYLIAGQTGGR
ncbi:MAG: hypothetical protein N3D11_04965 [Candidatus Sumerlaeia bacterium]|nr:hypothetical protein [Candidatus Sumerlaeia bacterium]